jgi:hypothetical protein
MMEEKSSQRPAHQIRLGRLSRRQLDCCVVTDIAIQHLPLPLSPFAPAYR